MRQKKKNKGNDLDRQRKLQGSQSGLTKITMHKRSEKGKLGAWKSMDCKGYNKKTRLWKPDNKHNNIEEWKRQTLMKQNLKQRTETSNWAL